MLDLHQILQVYMSRLQIHPYFPFHLPRKKVSAVCIYKLRFPKEKPTCVHSFASPKEEIKKLHTKWPRAIWPALAVCHIRPEHTKQLCVVPLLWSTMASNNPFPPPKASGKTAARGRRRGRRSSVHSATACGMAETRRKMDAAAG